MDDDVRSRPDGNKAVEMSVKLAGAVFVSTAMSSLSYSVYKPKFHYADFPVTCATNPDGEVSGKSA